MALIQFGENDIIPNILEDHIFKAVLTSDLPTSRKALTGLLSAILQQELEILTINTNEPALEILGDRQIRYDINVILKNGELANIEITKDPRPEETLRMEYYLARLYCSQKIRGNDKPYQKLNKSWQISILGGGNLYDDAALVHRFVYYDKANDTLFGGRTSIITLELGKVEPAEEKPVAEMNSLERWACFFRYSTDKKERGIINEIMAKAEDIAMAGEVIQGFTEEQIKLFHEISREKYRLDKLSEAVWYKELYEKAEQEKAELQLTVADVQQANIDLIRRLDALEQKTQ
jgi:predicted transposase/invertase (TIGR01784 family)